MSGGSSSRTSNLSFLGTWRQRPERPPGRESASTLQLKQMERAYLSRQCEASTSHTALLPGDEVSAGVCPLESPGWCQVGTAGSPFDADPPGDHMRRIGSTRSTHPGPSWTLLRGPLHSASPEGHEPAYKSTVL